MRFPSRGNTVPTCTHWLVILFRWARVRYHATTDQQNLTDQTNSIVQGQPSLIKLTNTHYNSNMLCNLWWVTMALDAPLSCCRFCKLYTSEVASVCSGCGSRACHLWLLQHRRQGSSPASAVASEYWILCLVRSSHLLLSPSFLDYTCVVAAAQLLRLLTNLRVLTC